MPSNRIGRINEEIQRELASLIPTVKDPRVAGAGMVSVTAVEATPDLKYAKIYVSALNKDSSGQLLKGLKWNDIDLDKGVIHVRRQVLRQNGEVVEAPLKTKNSFRSMPLRTLTVSAPIAILR